MVRRTMAVVVREGGCESDEVTGLHRKKLIVAHCNAKPGASKLKQLVSITP